MKMLNTSTTMMGGGANLVEQQVATTAVSNFDFLPMHA